jgi:hypothetical protein
MLVSADQVADTLRLLVPGFVLMKTFYVFGLKTRRSDAQWVIWSLLAAVPVNGLTNVFHAGKDNVTLLLAVLIAVAAGWLLGMGWTSLLRFRPSWGASAMVRAWDVIFGRSQPPEWLQVKLTDKTVYSGRPPYAARSVDTDDLDLYLLNPAILSADGAYVALPGVEGVLVPRSQISAIAVFSRAKSN